MCHDYNATNVWPAVEIYSHSNQINLDNKNLKLQEITETFKGNNLIQLTNNKVQQ